MKDNETLNEALNSVNSSTDYKNYAKEIYEKRILPNFENIYGTGDIWRSAWAFDTLIDYYRLIDNSDAQRMSGVAASTLFNPTYGSWWDDYGWAAIASLRAVENLKLDQAIREAFVKIAMNCWAYMYGPGWCNAAENEFNVPFPNANWEVVFSNNRMNCNDLNNVGAPNVFDYWMKFFAGSDSFKPRFSPGGLWNHYNQPLDGTSSLGQCPNKAAALDGFQNTVTNGLFTILSLRLYKTAQSAEWKALFEQSNFNTSKIYQAAHDQISWLDKWFGIYLSHPLESLQFDVNPALSQNAILVRERVSTYANGAWSVGYCPELAWAGDQGLIMAALREAMVHQGLSQSSQLQAGGFMNIINGVTISSWSNDGYPTTIKHPILRPWVKVNNGQSSFTAFPEGDDADYQTGAGVYLRYLLQAREAGVQMSTSDVIHIQNLANIIITGEFNNLLTPQCDAFASQTELDNLGPDWFTPWINQMAVLILASKLTA